MQFTDTGVHMCRADKPRTINRTKRGVDPQNLAHVRDEICTATCCALDDWANPARETYNSFLNTETAYYDNSYIIESEALYNENIQYLFVCWT